MWFLLHSIESLRWLECGLRWKGRAQESVVAVGSRVNDIEREAEWTEIGVLFLCAS